ncbi:uncharacterized protein WCC33_001410 [Rhinophrynus dorsalis]
MSVINTSNSSTSFILSGIPGLEEFHFWIGFPLVCMYIVAVLGNCTLLYIIKTEPDLHEPMYIFLFMLSVIDLLIANTTMPRMLGIFWFNSTEIAFNNCLVQMFFIHFLSALESGILVAMAVDRYVAICHPLRYSSIFTTKTITKTGVVILARGVAVMMPIPFLIKRLPYCRNNLLTHSFCLHQEIMKLACADFKVNIVYGLFIILSVMGIDSLFISLSYLLILRAVLGLVEEASLKAFSTCAAHICAVFVYYIPLIGLSVVHRFKPNDVFPNLPIFFANIYLLVPPVINPIVYGIKTKQIRSRLIKIFSRNKKWTKASTGLRFFSWKGPMKYTMIPLNESCFHPTNFILLGIPGLESLHTWISIPFFSIFLIALIGNYTLMLIIISERSLHQPMYIFFTVLAVVDLLLAKTTMPKLLGIFWFQYNEIDFHSCLLQMFFVHALSAIESGIFVAMAFDRYVAICNPLRYAAILTPSVIIKSGAIAVIRGVVYILPLPLLAKRFPQYRDNIIVHSYCEHMAVVRLACGDVSLNDHVGMTVGFLVLAMDSLFIVLSYIMILQALRKLSVDARLKSFGTCISHVCCILAFYIPILTSSLVHRFGTNVPHHTHILLANFYLLVPPMLNPLVYGIRTKQIREKVLKFFSESLMYTGKLDQFWNKPTGPQRAHEHSH